MMNWNLFCYRKAIGLTMLVIWLTAGSAYAQQEWSYTHYQFNLYDANSAYAGNHQTLSMAVRHRSQWIGLEGAPATDQVSLHAPVAGNRLGVGFRVVSDRIGARRQQLAKASVAYKLSLLNGQLAFGISGGMLRGSIERSELIAFDTNDAQLLQMGAARVTPVIGAAFMYNSKRMFFGVESGVLNQSSISASAGSLARLYRNLNVVGGYIQPIGDTDLLEISSQVKWSESMQWQVELNAQYLYRNKCWLGGGYRLQTAWQMLAAWMVNDHLRIGLSYDNAIGRIMTCNQSSAELFLGYTLQKRSPGSARYF